MRALGVSPIVFAVLASAACGSSPGNTAGGAFAADVASCAIPPIVDQSLLVTDGTALAPFSLEAVVSQMIASVGSVQRPLNVFQQMFDTLNDQASGVTQGPHCTDSLNGFANECPRQEGTLASGNPFKNPGPQNPDSFVPLALVNRFDLAPSDGSDCGEYRIIFGRELGPLVERVLLIFEAKLKNPDPARGLAACLPVAQFWDDLSAATTTPQSRAAALQSFYFTGLPGFGPVIDAANYGVGDGPHTGQIRMNLFLNAVGQQGWQLREFHAESSCAGKECTLSIDNVAVENNPDVSLFSGTSAVALAFQEQFLTQVGSLAASTVPAIAMTTPLVDDASASTSLSLAGDGAFPADPPVLAYVADGTFKKAIDGELTRLGIQDLTSADILARAQTQSCAGCHEISNAANLGGGVRWPSSLEFVQVDENQNLSPALTKVFLPARAATLTSFIDATCGATGGAPVNPGLTVGGSAIGAAN